MSAGSPVFQRQCGRCHQMVSTDDRGKVGFHVGTAGSAGRVSACPGKGT